MTHVLGSQHHTHDTQKFIEKIRMTSQTTNATNMAKITAEATPINSGIESTNSCTAPPGAPKKSVPSGSKTANSLKVNRAEMKRVKKDLSEEFKHVKKTMADEFKQTKKSLADELKQAKRSMADSLKEANKTIATLKAENAKLTKVIAAYERKVALLNQKNQRLLAVKNANTRPRLPKNV